MCLPFGLVGGWLDLHKWLSRHNNGGYCLLCVLFSKVRNRQHGALVDKWLVKFSSGKELLKVHSLKI